MGLLEKIGQARQRPARKEWSEPPFWDVERLRYPLLGSSGRQDQERIENDFEGYIAGIYKRSGPVFSLMDIRLKVFSEARFQYRRRRDGRPGDLFGDRALERLERPWVGGTTGDLLARMIQDADLAGNAFLTYYAGRIRRMRPDRVTIVLGSRSTPDADMPYGYIPLDIDVLGYLYSPRSLGSDDDVLLLPSQVAHFAPTPDPEAHFRGMSWLTPVLREISGDSAATTHKLKFFENAATPSFTVQLDASVSPDKAERFKALFDEAHRGVDNSFKTFFLGGGADVTPLTFDLRQLDFRSVQGAGETRLATAAGVPASIVGFSEGMQGSSLNAGTYGSAKRRFVDATMRPLWRNAAGSLATLIDVPDDAELWFDARDIPFLHEDARDAAEIFQIEASTAGGLVREGYTAGSAQAAVAAQDVTLLEHTGRVSVQLWDPNEPSAAPTPPDPAGGQ